MKTNSRRNSSVQQLILDCKTYLGDNFSQYELRNSFVILQEAKAKGFLGVDRLPSCCFADTVNVANQLLRICQSEELLSDSLKHSKTLYAYIALVSLNCIKSA
ncbi:MAG: hypothetical protein JGK17_05400 [Microcoleus sp. PH2017_10_PVI_O_A]|uniref:hypothetical protein n=1 Tax=unclassified Microcoleus TaxID=2642155 RepID=UPI001DA887FA|nr:MULTISPECIES: hypothetical protein [unclassified Microcoleus]TAE85646.1 MAG: hypothetical protein EAZ83_01905 [Oscillatoriales cyanobacterium]MCC3405023.1 hypothetical protein [Microcoleus sp. PH2017_10_PVI_O_A]MCC3459103.1 hypothetical protein [Microcoleus sp. PH2017_11_PCY_U_A]MCC3477160.1 hypothetical protein [Microcoleus sp. PH2017_12_PCY_D_A]MCC3527721.1 hypothetical protein [Microcoleus sp. PH2017_21_RUC_O_A]